MYKVEYSFFLLRALVSKVVVQKLTCVNSLVTVSEFESFNLHFIDSSVWAGVVCVGTCANETKHTPYVFDKDFT